MNNEFLSSTTGVVDFYDFERCLSEFPNAWNHFPDYYDVFKKAFKEENWSVCDIIIAQDKFVKDFSKNIYQLLMYPNLENKTWKQGIEHYKEQKNREMVDNLYRLKVYCTERYGSGSDEEEDVGDVYVSDEDEDVGDVYVSDEDEDVGDVQGTTIPEQFIEALSDELWDELELLGSQINVMENLFELNVQLPDEIWNSGIEYFTQKRNTEMAHNLITLQNVSNEGY